MSEPKWTPGPWLREGTTVYALDEVRGMYRKWRPVKANRIYFQVGTSAQLASTDEIEATAILAQHAPDLYEALEAIDESATDGREVPEWLQERLVIARAALAEARGERSEETHD